MAAARAAKEVRNPTQAREKDGASVDASRLSEIMKGPSRRLQSINDDPDGPFRAEAKMQRRGYRAPSLRCRSEAAPGMANYRKAQTNWMIQSAMKRKTTTAR